MKAEILDIQPYAKILRELGNFRTGYTIYVDTETYSDHKEAFVGIPTRLIHQKLQIPYNNWSDVIEVSQNAKNVTMVVAHFADLCRVPYMLPAFNEFQVSKAILESVDTNEQELFKAHTMPALDNPNVYMKKNISDGELVSFVPPKKFLIGDTESMPYHVAMIHKPSNTLLSVIWDSREIVDAMEISEEQKLRIFGDGTDIVSWKYANDNSNPLYMYKHIKDKITTFGQIKQYLGGIIINY